MQLTLTMGLGNAAYHFDDDDETLDTGAVARSLIEVATMLDEQGRTSGAIIDENGNRVGSWAIDG